MALIVVGGLGIVGLAVYCLRRNSSGAGSGMSKLPDGTSLAIVTGSGNGSSAHETHVPVPIVSSTIHVHRDADTAQLELEALAPVRFHLDPEA